MLKNIVFRLCAYAAAKSQNNTDLHPRGDQKAGWMAAGTITKRLVDSLVFQILRVLFFSLDLCYQSEMRNAAVKFLHKSLTVIVLAAYSIWSVGVFAASSQELPLSFSAQHHAQQSLHDKGQDHHEMPFHDHQSYDLQDYTNQFQPYIAADHHNSGHMNIADDHQGKPHDHSNDQSGKCCGATCIPALASVSTPDFVPPSSIFAVPQMRLSNTIAHAPAMLYRPPIVL